MNPKIKQEKPLTMVEVQEHLKKIKKRDEELNFRANKTEENLNAVLDINKKEAEELMKKLNNLKIPRLKEAHISKLVDILPRTVDELKLILQGYTVTVNNTNLKKIVDTVNDVVPEKKK